MTGSDICLFASKISSFARKKTNRHIQRLMNIRMLCRTRTAILTTVNLSNCVAVYMGIGLCDIKYGRAETLCFANVNTLCTLYLIISYVLYLSLLFFLQYGIISMTMVRTVIWANKNTADTIL